jgi:hypothetical protein
MEMSLVDGRLYLYQCSELALGGKMNYWERRKSFWTTSKGFIIMIAAVLIILGGAIIGINLYTSPFPVIESFEAKPMALTLGEATNLSWSVIGATVVEIDQGIGRVSLKGDMKISPLKTTTYSLTAINGTRNRTKSTKVIVEQ